MTPELDLLRPALEMAMIVARQGDRAPVRVEVPRPLRPFLRFTKMPPRALAAARVALDDDEFRARVVAHSDEEEVGRAGWLLLTRPDGWEEEFEAIVEDRDRSAEIAAERSARHELERAVATVREQQQQIDAQARDLHRLRQQLDARNRVDDEHRAALAEAQARTEAALDDRARAVRELKEMERRLGERTAELRRLEAAAAPASDPSPAAAPDPRWGEVDDLADELRSRWDALGDALDRLEVVAGSDVAGAEVADSARGGKTRHRHGRHRRPLRLGRGLVDGTPEAARWLLGRPGAVALVDGYNVTMLAWPELAVADQRQALERAAGQLQLQLGTQMVLVFDGDDEGGAAVRSAVGSQVRVRFTHRDTEADDEILDMVDSMTVPVVVVVSNDRRVLAGARERGANTVRSTDFLALLR